MESVSDKKEIIIIAHSYKIPNSFSTKGIDIVTKSDEKLLFKEAIGYLVNNNKTSFISSSVGELGPLSDDDLKNWKIIENENIKKVSIFSETNIINFKDKNLKMIKFENDKYSKNKEIYCLCKIDKNMNEDYISLPELNILKIIVLI